MPVLRDESMGAGSGTPSAVRTARRWPAASLVSHDCVYEAGVIRKRMPALDRYRIAEDATSPGLGHEGRGVA